MNDLVLLTVDSLRADRATSECIGRSLEVLNEDFVFFNSAYSHGVATPFAFPGIIAGSHPVGNGKIPQNADTIAESLPGRSTAYANNGHLREERGYTRGFTHFEESPSICGKGKIPIVDKIARRLQTIDLVRESTIAKKLYNDYLRDPLPISSVPADGMTKLVRRRLNKESDNFVWGHWMDPHLPYHPETAIDPPKDLPSLEELEDIKNRIAEANANDLTEEELDLSERLYDSNIRYFDKYFAELLHWMRDQSWYEDAMIAVISDHGEYFGEHRQLFHTWDIDPYDEAIHTPLWVKYPSNEDGGSVIKHVVGHGDLLATVEDVLEESQLTPPRHTAPLRQSKGRHVVSVSNTAKRLTEDKGTYIMRRNGTSDKHRNVSEKGIAFTESIAFPECRNSRGEALGVEDAERRRRLENLGYR
jgi:hypothetical protein